MADTNVTEIGTAKSKAKGKAKAKAKASSAKTKAAPAKAGHNLYDQKVRAFVYRMENINRDREGALYAPREDMKALGKEIKEAGYKSKAIREIVRRRAMTREDRDLVDQYELALGTEEEKT